MYRLYVQIDINTSDNSYIESYDIETNDIIKEPSKLLEKMFKKIGEENIINYNLQVTKK